MAGSVRREAEGAERGAAGDERSKGGREGGEGGSDGRDSAAALSLLGEGGKCSEAGERIPRVARAVMEAATARRWRP